ncbi:embryogenesis-like protein [Euphorbia lathyris]|uniref:embryogenesis-like protein n=1 Tax=Euphorbia lathyris TaxID=212925 RepID=UPI0033142AD7
MQKQSQISLFKLFLRHPFQLSSKPKYAFLLQSLTSNPPPLLTNSLIPLTLKFLHTSTSIPYFYTCPICENLHACSSTYKTRRKQSTASGGDPFPDLDVNKEVDTINLKFAEAREEIEMAMESKETVYFNEEAECARAAVKEVLDMFEGLLGKLPEGQKGALQRSMGLKIEQLKAEIQQLDD